MSFWKRGKQRSVSATGQARKAKRSVKRSPPVAMEIKVLAIEALGSGLSAAEVGELVGVGSGTIHKWRKDYEEGGVQGLCRRASSIAVRKQCSVLEEKIVARRRENPEHGVRRIRDDLRRQEGLEVSAEKSEPDGQAQLQNTVVGNSSDRDCLGVPVNDFGSNPPTSR